MTAAITNLREFRTAKERREAIARARGVPLDHIGAFTFDESVAGTKNCENMIGAAQIPLGIAGPLAITGVRSGGGRDYYLPLATHEGALVASVSRGCKAITESGGAVVDSHRVGATRGPVFRMESLKQHDEVYRYLSHNLDELKAVAEKTSSHLTLTKLLTRGVGRYRFVRFVFDTTDAMGMNMVTIASEALAQHLSEKFGIRCVAVAGNFDTDKKPSWLNGIENRGIKVWADVTVPASVLRSVLKTDAASLYEVWLSKCMIGSAVSGSMGFNAQFANVVAALFLATGQDPGHIGEASTGITTAEVVNGTDLYISVTLPDLMVGTVGGGTGLATQREALQILGIAGGNDGKNAETLAEIIAGAVLAGELSLLSSLAQGTLASAHRKLGRGEAA